MRKLIFATMLLFIGFVGCEGCSKDKAIVKPDKTTEAAVASTGKERATAATTPKLKATPEYKAQKIAAYKAYLENKRRIAREYTKKRKAVAALIAKPLRNKRKTASLVPVCDGIWHWVDVPGTQCITGTQTGFEYLCQIGLTPSDPLLLTFVDAVFDGGACWMADQCDCQPDVDGNCTGPGVGLFRGTANLANSNDGITWAASSFGGGVIPGSGDLYALSGGPTSPLNQTYNIVHFPYCTGDAHFGDKNVNFVPTIPNPTVPDPPYVAHFKGFKNLNFTVPKVKQLFPNPSKVAMYGQSGTSATMCNMKRFRDTWPAADMIAMHLSTVHFLDKFIPGLTTPEGGIPGFGFSSILKRYGVWHFDQTGQPVSDTCPIDKTLPVPQSQGPVVIPGFVVDAGPIESYNRRFIPSVRKGMGQDYSDETLTGVAFEIGTDDPTPFQDSILSIFNDTLGGSSVNLSGNQSYRAEETQNDQTDFKIFYAQLTAGETIDVGTCGLPGSAFHGNTFLRLRNPQGVEVASNNNACPGGGARITYTVPPTGLTGEYILREGCTGNSECQGTIGFNITGPSPITNSYFQFPAYTANNTNSDQVNFVSAPVYLVENQTIDVGTCGVQGSRKNGNTFLRLFNPSNVQVAVNNNDGCGTTGSRLEYTVPPGGPRGLYTVRQGCAANTSCGGTTAYWIIGPTNYKVWYHTGTCHDKEITWGTPPIPSCDYDVLIQGPTMFNNWIRGLFEIAPFVPSFINQL